jgi:hypothetical protein
MEDLQLQLQNFKQNLENNFQDTLQYNIINDQKIILQYLDKVATEFQLKFGDWNSIFLLWAALGSQNIIKTK